MLVSSDVIHNRIEDTAHGCGEDLPVSLAGLKGKRKREREKREGEKREREEEREREKTGRE